MGLPLFVAPAEAEVASKSAEKIAADHRSSIRRRSIMNPRRSSSDDARTRRMLGIVERVIPESESRSSLAETQLAAVTSLRARAQRMLESEHSAPRDHIIFERIQPHRPQSEGPMMPPVPESRDYASLDSRRRDIQRSRQARIDARRMSRRHPAPTPPYTDFDRVPSILRETDSPQPFSLTPALSPSRQTSDNPSRWVNPEESQFNSTRSAHPRNTPPITDPHSILPLTESTRLLERAEALRRSADAAGGYQLATARATARSRFDGLGDRHRSLSPEGGSAWDTLLTSITPDPQPPSAGSSFASTSAAAASSNSEGPMSSSVMTISQEAHDRLINDCDLSDTDSASNEDEEDIYELQGFNERGRGDGRSWRTYASVVSGDPNRASQDGSADTDHLVGMHRIISRLAERDEIPDSWWASAGLSRNLRREPTI